MQELVEYCFFNNCKNCRYNKKGECLVKIDGYAPWLFNIYVSLYKSSPTLAKALYTNEKIKICKKAVRLQNVIKTCVKTSCKNCKYAKNGGVCCVKINSLKPHAFIAYCKLCRSTPKLAKALYTNEEIEL